MSTGVSYQLCCRSGTGREYGQNAEGIEGFAVDRREGISELLIALHMLRGSLYIQQSCVFWDEASRGTATYLDFQVT